MSEEEFTSDGEFERQMYLEVLRDNPPLKRYVSRGDVPDEIDIAGPHADADASVFRAIRLTRMDKTSRLQPVLGGAGMGKTHFFWVLRDTQEGPTHGPYVTVYVPSPPSPVRVPLHFYACLVDEQGDWLFERAADQIISRFGQLRGIVRQRYDYNEIVTRAANAYPGVSMDVVKALLRFRLDEDARPVAKRWLLGDAVSQEDLDLLDVRSILEEDDMTIAALKILTEASPVPIVMFIDEFEGPYNTHGEVGERQFVEVIKRVYNQCFNTVIVASCLSDIWDRVYSLADQPTRSRMEEPAHLRPFTREDLAAFVRQTMSNYWEENNLEPPSDPIFPLTEKDIDEAFSKSKGVPREAIRYIIGRIEGRSPGAKPTAEEEQADYTIKLTPSMAMSAVAKALTLVGNENGVGIQLQAATGGTKTQSTAILILSRGETTRRLGLDVPTVKDWDRSGGVSAYYSVARLKKMLDKGEADVTMVVIPAETKGAKFDSASAELGQRLIAIRLNTGTATQLIEDTRKEQLSEEERTLFTNALNRIMA
ncbi:MAG: hypothetical protein QXS20_08730 [Candidatus Thorarchaeota archaeon]